MSELVMAAPGLVGRPLKSGNNRCTTTPRAAEMTKSATECLVFLWRTVFALCKMTRKSI